MPLYDIGNVVTCLMCRSDMTKFDKSSFQNSVTNYDVFFKNGM